MWQLTIRCPQALSINLLYDKFWVPPGGKFFVYTTDKKNSIGAFTSRNNKGNKSDVQGFATGLLYGDEITLEYYQPKSINDKAIISVAYVVQGYRYIKLPETAARSLNLSGDCQVNINCEEGQNWQQEKNAVALILVNGNRYCTGSLVNTTANDNRPLLLTADHCLGGPGNNNLKYDAINNPSLNHWSFYWHYEAPTCNNTNSEPPILSTVGATVIANNASSDFALLRLTENPKDKVGVTPYYLGWDKSGNSGTGGVGIHHPSGDVKKISTLNTTPNNNWNQDTNFWSLYWSATPNGYSVTEGGSSGSPLINNSRHIIGQLYGGSNINCNNPSQDIAAYGKFGISWTGNGSSDSRRRLKDWLDPLNHNPNTLDGISLYYNLTISGPSTICTSATYTIDNLPQGSTVQWSSNSPAFYLTNNSNTNIVINKSSIVNNTQTGMLLATIQLNGNEFTVNKQITVYPTPNSGAISISKTSSSQVYDVYSITYFGQPVGSNHGSGETGVISYCEFTGVGGEVKSTVPGIDGENTGPGFIINKTMGTPSSVNIRYINNCGTSEWRNFPLYYNSYFSISPNPSSSFIDISANTELVSARTTQVQISAPTFNRITITDAMGNVKKQENIKNVTNYRISVSSLPNGIYYLNLYNAGKLIEKKTIQIAQ